MNTTIINTQFAQDVKEGLTASRKHLSSKYFYDEKGDKIFQSIMHMKEYYPTNSEYEIFSMQKNEIRAQIMENGDGFNLIEFGAGDGYKTKLLLSHFLDQQVNFKYVPIDISPTVLADLEDDLKNKYQQLSFEGHEGEYFSALEKLNELDNSRKVILFLGSNIGNFDEQQSISFLKKLSSYCKAGDQVIIGFDLKKDPYVILDAYGDKSGITKAFNLNLLERINRELDGNFDITQFDHFPLYDPITGTTKSYLISKIDQTVAIDGLAIEIPFKKWEVIHTEISQKFDLEMINNLAQATGFNIIKNFYDCKHYYLDSLWNVGEKE